VVSILNLGWKSETERMRSFERVVLRGLVASLGLLIATQLSAQTLTLLHSFAGSSEGANPAAGLMLSGQTMYGTTRRGGSSGNGTVYALKTDGTGFTNLHNFSSLNYDVGVNTEINYDGAYPFADLVLSGNTLYGTASLGGRSGVGTVFAINIDGAGFRKVYDLTGYPSDASTPLGGVVLLGGTVYGATQYGGSMDLGALFRVNTNGTGPVTLYSFTGGLDGCHLTAGLALSGTVLYGTAREGGESAFGTVFKINLDGSGFTTLHGFNNTARGDGSYPSAGLLVTNKVLYGITERGGSTGSGTLFKLINDGTGFTTLHNFTSVPGSGIQTNTDGAYPGAGLILSGTMLYGTTKVGGAAGLGTLFQININGTKFAVVHHFGGGASDGANPRGRLTLSNDILYGTTEAGGSAGQGTVFSLKLGKAASVQPTILCSGASVMLMWSTNLTGLTLQRSSNLFEPIVWTAVSSAPIISGDQNLVIDSISGPQQFYRLSQ
jgi:uncharacterized repeat protein (TIGR03803 family)